MKQFLKTSYQVQSHSTKINVNWTYLQKLYTPKPSTF